MKSIALAAVAFVRRLGRMWEPLVAISALFVALISAWVSIDALGQQRREGMLSRMPLVRFLLDQETGQLALENTGFGPAFIYRLDIEQLDQSWYLHEGDNPIVRATLLMDFVADTMEGMGPEVVSRLEGRDISYGDPISWLKADAEVRILRLPQEFVASVSPTKLLLYFSSLDMRVCYTDLTGEVERYAYSGDPGSAKFPPCGSPPSVD